MIQEQQETRMTTCLPPIEVPEAPPEVKFWKEGWAPKGPIKIPADYKRVASGSTYATRQAKRLAREAGQTVYVEMKKSKKGGYSRPVACWVPGTILPEVRRLEQETEERRSVSRERAEQSRTRRHERELVRLASRLGELFPNMSEKERLAVVSRAFEVGSDRVGRTAKLDEDRKLELAVIAHARHEHTNYDERLQIGEDREIVRGEIRYFVEKIVADWRIRRSR
jgi:hypothetical protein